MSAEKRRPVGSDPLDRHPTLGNYWLPLAKRVTRGGDRGRPTVLAKLDVLVIVARMSTDFRSTYVGYAALTEQLDRWAAAHPEVVRKTSLGTSDEGRELWLLTVGREPDRIRPAVWVDANMHASELTGTAVALAIAEDLIELHSDTVREGSPIVAMPAHLRAILKDGLCYILPRMSPDGAELVLDDQRWLRSRPSFDQVTRAHPRWVSRDIDGDGRSLAMRQLHPAGDWVPLEGFPDVLRPRRIDDAPPYFKLYPEGIIENFDGFHIPEPHYLSDNDTDLNRNFPFDWQPEPKQPGAGPFAASSAEALAVTRFAVAHPNIFAWLNLHCFGGVLIRPPGSHPDAKMDPDELALYRQLGVWAEALTDYPTVSGFEEFTYTPELPLRGDVVAFAHQQQGAFAWVVELWDLFKRLGIPRPKRFVDYYDRMGDDELARLAEFDRDQNQSRIFVPWKAVVHPQLGPVECGGLAPLIGIWNPPPECLPEVCHGQSAVLLRVATLTPRLEVEVTTTGLRAHIDVRNLGYLATYFIPSARKYPVAEPLWIELTALDGLALAPGEPARHAIGHLDGWGRGHLNPGQSILGPRSLGNSDSARRSVQVVRAVGASGTLHIRVGSSRVGWVERTVTF